MSMLPLPRRIVCSLAGIAAILGGLVSAGTAAAASGRQAIAGTHPAWAVPRAGTTAPAVTTGGVNLRVYLASQDPSGLAAYAAAVSEPGNGSYGDYLTPGQTQARFGATSAEVDAVKSWLTGAGLTVTGMTDGFGGYVSVSGTLAQASKAFGVSFANYTDPTGQTARAPESAATVPGSVAADVLAVSGLDTGNHFMKPQDRLPPPGPNYWVAPPTSAYYGQKVATNEPSADGKYWPWTNGGYTPQQVRGAYDVTASGMTGRGQTVAIVDAYASPTMPSDANEYSRDTGNAPFRPGQYQQYLARYFYDTSNSECGAQGWYTEETIDIESVHDMAPDANVAFLGAASCNDTDLAAADAEVVNRHLASIVTDSFGEPYDDAVIQPVWDQIFQAGAVEGIGFMFSSGDSGYEDPVVEDAGVSDKLQVDYPTSSPWVTSVGGTSLAIGPNDNYEWELPWGTLLNPLSSDGTSWSLPFPPTYGASATDWLYDGSSGGGVSTAYTQPWYQRGVVPYSLATDVPQGSTTTPMRVVPDVSAYADPSTGMLTGETVQLPNGSYAFEFGRWGGTSVASPTFAGIEADAQQAAGHDLGFANPAIYARYGTSAFHDVTEAPEPQFEVRNNYSVDYTMDLPLVTFLRAMGIDGQGAAALPATPGYDDSTGVGSPNQYVQSFFGFQR
ncbi:MAG TPA: S53 family peptidase [Solirubrobacteraceae bacterium]|nr:S53 family peptidase [Solirubrobacteraceae bacterium]